jgi:phage gp16-like protein
MSLDRGMLAKIHIAKKELGFDDETYRDILQTRYKKDSAAKLTRFEGEDLILHFKAQGWKVKRGAKGADPGTAWGAKTGTDPGTAGGAKTGTDPGTAGVSPCFSSPAYKKPMARKVVAIWINMALAGKVRKGSDAALQSYVKRMTGVDNLAWCDNKQLWRLIEALKSWANREGVEI